MRISNFLLGVVSLCLPYSILQAQPVSDYQAQAKQLKLLQHPTWQRLMYLKAEQSEVKHSDFFLQPNASATDELNAHIQALFADVPEQQSVRCRFPARSQWLMQQLNLQAAQLPPVNCVQFEQWMKGIAPYSATLVYATDFMGNPSSMFGHTLLRLDAKQHDNLDLVSHAVNYAAMTDAQDSMQFAWRGLTGQYPGQYSILPYYRKVKEYSDLQSRDLWEYELDLSEAETQFLVMHLWEMHDVSFPYYFVSDNCAYRLLGLIDLVRPDANLQQQFKTTAIPVETLKALQQKKLIRHTEYRPALETQLLHQVRDHGHDLARRAQQLSLLDAAAMADAIRGDTLSDQAKILEMSYDALYLKLVSGEVEAVQAQPKLRQLLVLRSQLDVERQRQMPETPEVNPALGHHARAWQLNVGQVQNDRVLELSHRSAYHDLIDPQGGFRTGTQLKALDVQLQYRQDQLKLKTLNLMSVNAYNPVTEFKHDLSWGFDLAWQQEALDPNGQFSQTQQHGVIGFKTQFGYSWANATRQHLCYGQFQSQIQIGKALDHGWRSAIGPALGCQNVWSSRMNTVVQAELPFWDDQRQWQIKLQAQAQYILSPQHTLRIGYDYQQQDCREWDAATLGYVWFY